MSFDPDKPYNDLRLLSPKAELESNAVLRKEIAANKALAKLKGAAGERVYWIRSRPSAGIKRDMSKKAVFLDRFL
jgi:hypothetical protein